MDFTLDKKHEMARDLFKQFAETEVKPLAQETDETEQFPAETVAKMGKYGFMGIPVPKEYGGQGCDALTYVMCVEELSKVCGTTGVIVSAHTSLCVDPIMTYGTEEQKQKYVKDLATGKKLGALTGISVDSSGMVWGSYDNGNTSLLCQIAVAQFANASGLEKVGNNCYRTTLNSGEFDGIGVEVSADGSSIDSGVLEMSNVDLSAQFTDMIVTQRGFQANSRVITTSDTLLEELLSLKR